MPTRILVAALLLLAPVAAFAEWTDKDLGEHYLMCIEAGGTPDLCICTVANLAVIQPERDQVTRENIREAIQVCRLPKAQPGELRI
jgi:hypothetical protein